MQWCLDCQGRMWRLLFVVREEDVLDTSPGVPASVREGGGRAGNLAERGCGV